MFNGLQRDTFSLWAFFCQLALQTKCLVHSKNLESPLNGIDWKSTSHTHHYFRDEKHACMLMKQFITTVASKIDTSRKEKREAIF